MGLLVLKPSKDLRVANLPLIATPPYKCEHRQRPPCEKKAGASKHHWPPPLFLPRIAPTFELRVILGQV